MWQAEQRSSRIAGMCLSPNIRHTVPSSQAAAPVAAEEAAVAAEVTAAVTVAAAEGIDNQLIAKSAECTA